MKLRSALLCSFLLLLPPAPVTFMKIPFNHSTVLGGLKAINGMGALTVQQTYALARFAGFDANTAKKMVAIAQRESRLQPEAVCIDCIKRADGTPIKESSIGLWQINTNNSSVWNLVQRATGISNPSELKDPAINARAAYALYGGNESNLNIAWSINRDIPGGYAYGSVYRGFLDKLPSTAQLEASLANPSSAPLASSGGSSIPTDTSSGGLPVYLVNLQNQSAMLDEGSLDTPTTVALIAGALLLVYALS